MGVFDRVTIGWIQRFPTKRGLDKLKHIAQDNPALTPLLVQAIGKIVYRHNDILEISEAERDLKKDAVWTLTEVGHVSEYSATCAVGLLRDIGREPPRSVREIAQKAISGIEIISQNLSAEVAIRAVAQCDYHFISHAAEVIKKVGASNVPMALDALRTLAERTPDAPARSDIARAIGILAGNSPHINHAIVIKNLGKMDSAGYEMANAVRAVVIRQFENPAIMNTALRELSEMMVRCGEQDRGKIAGLIVDLGVLEGTKYGSAAVEALARVKGFYHLTPFVVESVGQIGTESLFAQKYNVLAAAVGELGNLLSEESTNGLAQEPFRGLAKITLQPVAGPWTMIDPELQERIAADFRRAAAHCPGMDKLPDLVDALKMEENPERKQALHQEIFFSSAP